MKTPSGHLKRFGLDGRRALITGSARGLGWEIAKAMAEAGGQVIVNGRDASVLAARVAELSDAGLGAQAAVFDVTEADEVTQWFEAQDVLPDILVNNAGLRYRAGIEDCSPEDFQRLFDANLSSAFHIARTWALGRMKADLGGYLSTLLRSPAPVPGLAIPRTPLQKGGWRL